MSRVESKALPERIGATELLELAWPLIVSMLSYTLMAAVDAVFVARLGTVPLAAIGIAIPLLFLVRAYGLGVLQGVRVLTAQRTGAEDHAEARALGWQAVWMALALGVLAMSLIPVVPLLLAASGADPEVAGLAGAYVRVRLLAAPIDFVSFGMTCWFQGQGDTRTPMKANVTANVLNIPLDAVLIFGLGPVPALGIAGAAWATNLARVAGLVWLVWRTVPAVRGVSWRPSWDLVRRVVRLGHPLGVSDVLNVGAFTVFAGILAAAGEVHLAAHVVVIRIISISFLPGYALGNAAGVFVGQAVGANRPELAGQAIKSGLMLAVGVMVAFGVLFLAAPGPLLAIFSAAPEVAEVGRTVLAVAATFQLFDAVATVLWQALSGAGDTRFVMRVGVTASWLKLPLAWALALPLGFGAPGAWCGFTLELVALAIVFAWRVRSGRWLLIQQDGAPAPAPVG